MDGSGAIGGLVLLVWLIVVAIPPHLVTPKGLTKDQLLKDRNDVRSTLLQAAGGLAVGSGAYLAWRKLKDERATSLRQHELDRQGQITERFTTAIDQLGSDKIDIRLGGQGGMAGAALIPTLR